LSRSVWLSMRAIEIALTRLMWIRRTPIIAINLKIEYGIKVTYYETSSSASEHAVFAAEQ